MGSGAKVLWRSYWPLAVLPLAAGLLDGALWWEGQAWSLSDWAANFGLGAVTTMVVGMLLARRQGEIQEALADLQLTEKVAILTASVPMLRAGSLPGPTYRSLYDCRAAMALLPLASPAMQEEYLETVLVVLRTVRAGWESSLRSYAAWTDQDWADLADVVRRLRETTAHNARRSPVLAAHWSSAIDPETRELHGFTSGHVPFDLFRKHFTAGPDRIRTWLRWEALAELAARGDGSVRVRKAVTHVPPYGTDALDRFYAPWYRDSHGPAAYDSRDAVPVRLTEAAADSSAVPPETWKRILVLRDQYARSANGPGISLVFASYSLGDGSYLVLDGNHRLSALVQLVAQGCPVTLTEFQLTAPLDPALLPDLARFPGTLRSDAPG
ncbi:ParB N-terminal domain-containing protein [Kitasatospora fiedleri]|uniref:hypothetical protein n=1 Tax=Kitasatospora fiedleri TaxID=2991545 RepID=UPI00249A371C|nr:hypothetical protein [Kitasatospora fiedleri]